MVASGQTGSGVYPGSLANHDANAMAFFAGEALPAPGAALAGNAVAEANPQPASQPAAGNDASQAGCNGCNRNFLPLVKFDDCDPLMCEDVEPRRFFRNSCTLKYLQTTVTGWFESGLMGNGQDPASHFNGPVTYPDKDDGQLDQFYLAVERTAPKDNCGLYVGGRMDLYYGSDYLYTTAAGLDGTKHGDVPRWGNSDFTYGLSMPQVYGEIDLNALKIKLGHFYSIVGYEAATAKDNFFYSHSYASQYGEPNTHTGILASKTINDNWSWNAGIVAGWNTFDFEDGANFIGSLTYTVKDWGSLALEIITGNESTVFLSGIGPFADRTLYSIAWTRNLTSRWTSVLQNDFGIQDQAATLEGTGTARWYSIDQYLFYKLNCCWTAGARFEWFHDSDGFVVTGLRPGNPLVGNFFGGSFYDISFGLNYKPSANLTIRPELRYDWFDPTSAAVGSQFPFNDNTSQHQLLFGVDAICQF